MSLADSLLLLLLSFAAAACLYQQLTWLSPAFFRLEVVGRHLDLKSRILKQLELRGPQGPLHLGKCLLLSPVVAVWFVGFWL